MKSIPYFTVRFLSLCLTIVISLSSTYGQANEKDYLKMEYAKQMVFIPGDESISPYFISERPVTNKEYILYLVWLQSVFSQNQPEVLYNALPGFKGKTEPGETFLPFIDSASFHLYLRNSESFVSEYIFNHYYLNSAVVGINWEQANNYCQWLSDRYNEYALSDHKYIYITTDVIDEYNFTTESFIMGMYEGINRNYHNFEENESLVGFQYVNNIMRPSFHLATRYELQTANKYWELVDCLCASSKVPEFLKIFYEYYLPEKRDFIYSVTYGDEEAFWIDSDLILDPDYILNEIDPSEKITEWCLDSYEEVEAHSIQGIYRKFGSKIINYLNPVIDQNLEDYISTDSIGKMPYIIIGENDKQEFEVVSRPANYKSLQKIATPYIFDHQTGTVVNSKGDIFTCFRFAVNAVKK